MANSIITITGRKKMMQARAGIKPMSVIVGFAFGNGGVDSSGNVITPTDEQTELNSEIYRKIYDKYEVQSDTVCRYFCTLAETELVGKSISEIALYDEDDDLVAIKTFLPKGKDDDLEMQFEIDDKF